MVIGGKRSVFLVRVRVTDNLTLFNVNTISTLHDLCI